MISFSIIIPAFNRVPPLKVTLTSALEALARCPRPAEIIVVDDGSSPPLVDVLGTLPPAVRCLRQVNQGSIAARLHGLREARGEFVLFLDSDDLIHPEKLTRHLATFAATGADVVYDDLAVVTADAAGAWSFQTADHLPATTDPLHLFLTIQPAPHGPTYRRRYLAAALQSPLVPAQRAFDPSGDVWLYYNLLLAPARLAKVEAALTAPGVHEEARYSHHWEKLGLAALLIAEGFASRCPHTAATRLARQRVGDAALRSFRRLPRDFRPGYGERLLALWRHAPRSAPATFGGARFVWLARLCGTERAARVLRRFNHDYASCRTMTDAELDALYTPHHL